MSASKDPKPRLIQLIHVAKSQLKIDDDTYRNILKQFTQKDSTKQLTVGQLNRVISHFQSLGFKIQPKPRQQPVVARDPQSRKIRALWLQLHTDGHVNDASETALAAYVKRITAIEALSWLNDQQANKVIETLKSWQKRVQPAESE